MLSLNFRGRIPGLFILLVIILQSCCLPLAGRFDPVSYTDTRKLMEETVKLAEKGTEPYELHQAEVKRILSAADHIYLAQKSRKNNKLTVKQWEILLKEDTITKTNGILTGYLIEWENASTKALGAYYVKEKTKKIRLAFEEILRLEETKKGYTPSR
jgi:hypothetical protein